ncbi:MAG: GNAT family N-acetyltransferase [Bacilli bacterium]|nr:GNAT family N-acetyltransferase [Bacilli bacterium]
MIKLITKENYEDLNDDFLSLEYLKKEFASNPFAKFLIFIENDELIGYLYYSDIYDRIEINQFEVKEKYRNQGKGNMLLEYLISNNKKDISLEVRENNTYAIKLYEKNNFKKVSVRNGYYEGIDGILMYRKYE